MKTASSLAWIVATLMASACGEVDEDLNQGNGKSSLEQKRKTKPPVEVGEDDCTPTGVGNPTVDPDCNPPAEPGYQPPSLFPQPPVDLPRPQKGKPRPVPPSDGPQPVPPSDGPQPVPPSDGKCSPTKVGQPADPDCQGGVPGVGGPYCLAVVYPTNNVCEAVPGCESQQDAVDCRIRPL